jgi:enamine deaminase RidA (YjgF/YER057c/UK114 family)
MVFSNRHANSKGKVEYSFVDLGDSARVAVLLAPHGRGSFAEQAREVMASLHEVLQSQSQPMAVTVQTVFLREAGDQTECARLMAAHYGTNLPVTNFVLQPPLCGAALALEAWTIGGQSVRVEHFGPQTLAVSYDHIRWVQCAGVTPAGDSRGVYAQTMDALQQMRAELVRAGSTFERAVRTWFYLGGITDLENQAERYQEFNRARADFYRDIQFHGLRPEANGRRSVYPASTGIGMAGMGLVTSCLTLETQRDDVRLLPLENPQQTPAYAYHPKYSPASPKFSRAMALVLGDYVTTWISGTASIVNSESRYPGNIEKQTEQTIDNIERLIAAENFALHNIPASARLHDVAKIRVYIKRPEDFAPCKAVCERRFGAVPAIYAVADVCRPELLVEIEGVAFSKCAPRR